jgi:hypothetical protein
MIPPPRAQELATILGLPDRVTPIAVIPIGRRAKASGLPRRRPVDEVAHRNRFGEPFPGASPRSSPLPSPPSD